MHAYITYKMVSAMIICEYDSVYEKIKPKLKVYMQNIKWFWNGHLAAFTLLSVCINIYKYLLYMSL